MKRTGESEAKVGAIEGFFSFLFFGSFAIEQDLKN